MIYDKLYDYQKNIVEVAKRRQRFGIFLDMGLGKTPIASSIAEELSSDFVLVVSLKSKAIEKTTDKGSWQFWLSQTDCPYEVTNYEHLTKRGADKLSFQKNIEDIIQNANGKRITIICDESHKLKNQSTAQTKAIIKLIRTLETKASSLHVYLLTGTPFTTGYIDLYTQLVILGYKSTKTQFIDDFCVRGNIRGLLGWQQPIVGYKNVDKLFDLVNQFAVTMKSTDALTLPDQIFVDVEIKTSDKFKLFNKMQVAPSEIGLTGDKKINNPYYRDIDYPTSRWTALTSGNAWLRARQLSIGFQGNAEEYELYDGARFERLKKLLAENPNNYVLFYNYTPELLEIFPICEELGYNIDVYCGEIKSLTHYERFEKMKDSEKIVTTKNIILANFQSGSTGKNWQEYNKCILFSVPVYRDFEQGIKRVHRVGQKSSVVYYRFFADNYLDKSMMEAIGNKETYDSDMFEKVFEKSGIF